MCRFQSCFSQSRWAQIIRCTKKDFKHSIWTPPWPFLQVIYSICCLVYLLITCIHAPWLFSSHISTLWEWCLPLSKPWRKRVRRWVNKRGESKWRWELKVNTRGWSVTVSPPRFTCGLLSVSLSLFSPRGCWLTVVLFAAKVFIKINTSVFICMWAYACGSSTSILYVHDWVHVGYWAS